MATKLKIGLVLDTSLDPPDGVQQYVVAIGEWLRGQGHNVHYLVGETKQRQLPNVHSLSRNLGVVFNGNRTTIPWPARRHKLRSFIKRQQFDVLHVQTPHHPFMAQYLISAVSDQTAVVATFHILPYDWLSSLGSRLLAVALRPSLKRIDTMLAVSSAAAAFEEHSFGLPATVSPNVIDYTLFHDAQPYKRYRDSRLTILFLGRLVPRKGAQQLVAAAARLTQDPGMPAFRVLICGRGPLEVQLRAMIAEHHLEGIVKLIGYVEETDKPRYYASADIAVFPSSGGESFGIVLLEAMASGRAAVLGGNNPGYASVLAPRPELLFPANDVDALVKKLTRYASDVRLRRQTAKWGADYAASFDVDSVGRDLLKIYRRALRKRLKA